MHSSILDTKFVEWSNMHLLLRSNYVFFSVLCIFVFCQYGNRRLSKFITILFSCFCWIFDTIWVVSTNVFVVSLFHILLLFLKNSSYRFCFLNNSSNTWYLTSMTDCRYCIHALLINFKNFLSDATSTFCWAILKNFYCTWLVDCKRFHCCWFCLYFNVVCCFVYFHFLKSSKGWMTCFE